jgi:hypothetical protein
MRDVASLKWIAGIMLLGFFFIGSFLVAQSMKPERVVEAM